MTSPEVTGSDRKLHHRKWCQRKWWTGNDLSNLTANIQISRQNSHFPAEKNEFIVTIQIDQWERFPPKKNLWIIPRNQSEAASFFYPMNSLKQNQWKPSTVPTNRRRTLHLYFSNSKSITSSAILKVNGRIVDYSLFYCLRYKLGCLSFTIWTWIFIIHYLKVSPLIFFSLSS